MTFFEFLQDRADKLWQLTLQHIEITFLAVIIACLIGIPLGIVLIGRKNLTASVMAVINACQAVPSLAFLGLLIPLTGIGLRTTIILVIIYSILPITKNTFTAINSLAPEIIETAKGIGLTKWQILVKIQLPLSLPVIMAGVRIASVWAVGTVTVAAYAGGGGLGSMIYSGISMMNTNMILAGALLACVLAMTVDWLIGLLEKKVTSDGLREKRKKKSVF